MADILPFPSREEPTVTGPAKCLHCDHAWEAVAPAGKLALECPSCHLLRGAWYSVVHTADTHWQCRCGCAVFGIDRVGAICMRCGIRSYYENMV
jgi:hypothetical protein